MKSPTIWPTRRNPIHDLPRQLEQAPSLRRLGLPRERPVTERDNVRFGDTTIEYEIRRSRRRRKTIQITVNGGSVHVMAPMATPDEELRGMVRKRAPWILSHASEATPQAPPKRFVSGETLPYLGRNIRLVVESGDVRSPEVRFDHWQFRVVVPWSLDDGKRYELVRHALITWYRARAAEELAVSVDRWWPRLGRGEKSRILVRDQRRRWASCAPDGTLRFNWRVMMLDPSLMEYIVVHEMAHLTHLNHSKNFWGLVSKTMPDVQQLRQRLREASRALPV